MKALDRVKCRKATAKKESTFSSEKTAQILLGDNVHEKNDIKLDQAPVGFTSPNKTTYSDKGSESVPITIAEDKRPIAAT